MDLSNIIGVPRTQLNLSQNAAAPHVYYPQLRPAGGGRHRLRVPARQPDVQLPVAERDTACDSRGALLRPRPCRDGAIGASAVCVFQMLKLESTSHGHTKRPLQHSVLEFGSVQLRVRHVVESRAESWALETQLCLHSEAGCGTFFPFPFPLCGFAAPPPGSKRRVPLRYALQVSRTDGATPHGARGPGHGRSCSDEGRLGGGEGAAVRGPGSGPQLH